MKKLLLCFLLCAAAAFSQTTVLPKTIVLPKTTMIGGGSASGTFTLVQHVLGAACTGGTNTCSITVSATTSGNIGILDASDFNGASLTISSVSGGGTWTSPAGCVINTTGLGTTMCSYNLNLTGGATTITVTWSSTFTSNLDQLRYYEYHYSGSSVSFDNAGTVSNAASNTPSGVTPSLSGTKDVIVQGITAAAGVISAQTVYGNGLYTTIFGGTADLENTTSTSPPVWTDSASAVSLVFYVALKGN